MSTGRTYFSFDIDLTFLFKDLKVDKTDVFVGAVVAVFVLAFLSSVLQNILWILSHRSLADAFREKWRFFSSATTRRKSTPTFPLNAYGVSPKINNTASQEHSPTIWSWSAQPKRSRRSRLMSLRNCCSPSQFVRLLGKHLSRLHLDASRDDLQRLVSRRCLRRTWPGILCVFCQRRDKAGEYTKLRH